MKHPIYLVDGSGYIFRAFYAVQHLSAPDGFPTNALFGFSRMLIKLLREAASTHIAIAFDKGRTTFRTELYKEYKANRKEPPEDLVPQFPYFRTISRLLGLPVLELDNYEADDIIATLTRRLTEAGRKVVVVSGDKDLLQLVSPSVEVWDTMQDRHYSRAEVIEKFDVPPEKVVEYLALVGDSSDNVPGVPGVGPKTAAQLIQKFGDIEGVIQGVSTLRDDKTFRNRSKIADAIESDVPGLRLSRKLVEVAYDTPVLFESGEEAVSITALDDAGIEALLTRAPIAEKELTALFDRFGFRTLITEVLGVKGAPPRDTPVPSSAFEAVTVTETNYPDFLDELNAADVFAFDVETDSLDPHEARLIGISFCFRAGRAYYLPLHHGDILGQRLEAQLSPEKVLADLRPVFADRSKKKRGQNLKFDIEVLAAQGVNVSGPFSDSMIAAHLLRSDRGGYDMTALALDFLTPADLPLGGRIMEFKEVLEGAPDFSRVPIERATQYGCQDAQVAFRLCEVLEAKLAEAGLLPLMNELEAPLIPVLARMELKGVLIDSALLASMSKEFELQLETIRASIYEIAGCEFNINSPKQLADLLFEKLGISTRGLKRTKTGVSTDSAVLEKLSEQHPLPARILDYRALFKLKSTYIDALPAQVSDVTGRLHTRLNQTGTSTGRLSSSEPNLQNIPIQTKEGARIREAFVAPPGMKLISADYSQIELRLLAHLSNDENLCAAFREDLDIHARTARELLGVTEVTPEQRRIGKTMNFGIIYGMSGFRLARELGISVQEANLYIERYFDHFSGVRSYFAELERQSAVKGYVETLMGRRRVITDIDAGGKDRGFLHRVTLNAPIQGSAADVIKKAMVDIDSWIMGSGHPSLSMLLQIHDELLFEVPESEVEDTVRTLKDLMENAVRLTIPLRVDVGVGNNWREAHG